MMKRIAVFVYGVAAYLLFFGTFLYLIGFVGNLLVPKGIDDGEPAGLSTALLYNLPFLALFAIQHTIMARPAFKRWWTRIIPVEAERSTFVLVTCLILIAMVWQWRPVPEVIWSVENPIAQVILLSIFGTGWVVVLASSFLIDHFDLFGLRQSYFCLRGWEYKHPVFVKRAFYKYVRHPLMVGFLLAVWATPTMTVGHLILALGITGYILVGTLIEERDLVKLLGEDYREYQRTTPKFIPIPKLGVGKKPVVAMEEA